MSTGAQYAMYHTLALLALAALAERTKGGAALLAAAAWLFIAARCSSLAAKRRDPDEGMNPGQGEEI